VTLSVPTPSGVLHGIALFNWDGANWQPSGLAAPSVATPTGVLEGVAGFTWNGTAWAPTGVPVPSVATPSGILDGAAIFSWNGTAWAPTGVPVPSVATPSGVLRGMAAFSWDGANWQPAGQAGPDIPTPYGVLRGVAPYTWNGVAWAPGSAVAQDVVVSTTGPVSLTGTTAETNMASLRIPAGSMGKNGVIELRSLWSYPNSVNLKTMTARFGPAGSTTAWGLVMMQTNTTAASQLLVIFRNNNAANAQMIYLSGQAGGNPFGSLTSGPSAGAADTTVDQYININGTLGLSTETLILQRATAVVFYAP